MCVLCYPDYGAAFFLCDNPYLSTSKNRKPSMKCSESCSFGGRRVWIIVGKALPMQIKELIRDWARGEGRLRKMAKSSPGAFVGIFPLIDDPKIFRRNKTIFTLKGMYNSLGHHSELPCAV